MGIFELFPFTNFQEKNLDWLIRQLKKLEQKVNDYTKGFTFADPLAWDINKSYEPLTFVEYNDDIFGSSQAVPAGVQITNNDYWVRFTSYSNLISLINALDARVDDLEAELPPNPKRMIVVSDSYGLGRNGADSWVTHFANYMTDYANVYNWSNGSMGIVREGDGGYNARNYMISKASEVTYPNSVSDVVIAMGANDIVNHANFDTVFNALHSYINTTYPNAKISLAFIGNVREKDSATLVNYLTALDLYRAAAKKYQDVRFLEGLEYIMHDLRLMQTDGVHPTTPGAQTIGKGMAEAFRSGSYRYTAYQYLGENYMVGRFMIDGPSATITFVPGNSIQTTFPDRNYKNYFTFEGTPMFWGIAANPIFGYFNGFDSNIAPLHLSMRYQNKTIELSTMKTVSTTLATNAGMYGCTIGVSTLLV